MNELKLIPMKTKVTLFLAAVLLLTGCDLFKDAATITIPTDLTVDVPVVAIEKKSADLVSDVNAIDFSGSATLSLADNPDIADYLEKIREVTLEKVVITVNELGSATVNTITASVANVGTLGTQTNVTSTNNSFTPTVDQSVYDAAEARLLDDKQITVTVTGNVSGPVTFTVHFNFTSEIVAGVLD